MRSFVSGLAALVLATTLIQAQQQPAPPAVPAADPRLEAVLGYWEKAMLNVQTLSAEVKRTKLDKTFQTTEVFEGTAQFMRGGAGPAKA